MTLEEYAEKNNWTLGPWSGQNSRDLQVWKKEFESGRTVEVGNDMFTAVVFRNGGSTTLRTRRNGHNDFVPTLDTLIRADELDGRPWVQSE